MSVKGVEEQAGKQNIRLFVLVGRRSVLQSRNSKAASKCVALTKAAAAKRSLASSA